MIENEGREGKHKAPAHPPSTPCPYRTEATLVVVTRFGCQTSSGMIQQ